MKLRFLLSLFSLVLVLSTASAQTTAERAADRATNRAENRAQSNVDRKVDGAVDDAFNAIGGLFKKKDKKKKKRRKDDGANGSDEETYNDEDEMSDEAATAMLQNMGLMGGEWEPYTNPIVLSMDMEISNTKRNGKEESSTVSLAIAEKAFGVKTTMPESSDIARMILDTQTGKVIVVSQENGKTQAIRMSMPGLGKAIHETYDEADFTIERTGERRTIDGYNCEKIIVTDEDGSVTTSWVTQDLDIKMRDIAATFGGMTRGKSPASDAMNQEFQGFPIESTYTDGKGKETTTMKMRNIKLGSNADMSVMDTSGLNIQDIGY